MVVGYISLGYGFVVAGGRTVVKGDCFGNKSIKLYIWSAPGFEPGTSCTRSRNHTSRPSGHFLMKDYQYSPTYIYSTYLTFSSTLSNPAKTGKLDRHTKIKTSRVIHIPHSSSLLTQIHYIVLYYSIRYL